MILVLGDIHGRTIWKDIIDAENPDLIIFLGDYVTTHEYITASQQIVNLEAILQYKEENLDKVILLRGNHDLQELGYHWAECSGFDYEVAKYMRENKDRFLSLTQWVYIYNNIVFSHAGISSVWLNNTGCTVEEINNLPPTELFAFTPDQTYDVYGTSVTQPLTWIRPQILATCNIPDYDQIVGHTPVKQIVNMKACTKHNRNILLCDTLGHREYLVFKDNKFIPKILPK